MRGLQINYSGGDKRELLTLVVYLLGGITVRIMPFSFLK